MRIAFQSVTFGRRPTESEQTKGRKAIKEAAKCLAKILHGGDLTLNNTYLAQDWNI